VPGKNRALSESGFCRTSIFPELRASSIQKATDGAVCMVLENGAVKLGFSETGPFTPVPLDPMFSALPFRSDRTLSMESLKIDWQYEGRDFRIVFLELSGEHSSDGLVLINACKLVLFER
jgi:hypothetical protein